MAINNNDAPYGYLVTPHDRRPATLNEAIRGLERRRLPTINGYIAEWVADSTQWAAVFDAMEAQAEDAQDAE